MSLKVESIIAWKVAGELHSPKNITVGSKSPRFVENAAFHWSPSLWQGSAEFAQELRPWLRQDGLAAEVP